jgi:hypothetical protein
MAAFGYTLLGRGGILEKAKAAETHFRHRAASGIDDFFQPEPLQ